MSGDGLYRVNWKNPMLLGDQHLRQMEECAAQARAWIARAAAPAVGSFGLLSPARGGGPGLRIRHEHGADRLSVHIQTVFGLAPDGTPIAFDEDAYPQLSGQLSAHADLERNPSQPVRLAVLMELAADGPDGSGHIEVGEPDPTEDPPRRPLVAARPSARIEPAGASARGALKVAEYLWDGVEVEPSPDYLPPVLSVGAWPDFPRRVQDLRTQLDRLCDVLVHGSNAPESLVADVTLPWLAGVASLVDGAPASSTDLHPHAVWDASTRALRISRTMLSARSAAVEHSLKMFVQPGKLSSGDPNYFEDLDDHLARPYAHDGLGPQLGKALELVVGMREIAEFLLGSAPVREEAVVEHDVYYYKDKKYRLAEYAARTVDAGEAWHTCFLRDLSIPNPKSLLLVCEASLLEQNPRPNAGLWMLDRFERVTANMFRVNVDNASDPGKVVALFQEVGEPTVTAVSLASRGLLDLSGLDPTPDDRLRIYYEES